MFGNEKYPQDHIAIIRATSGLYYIYVSNLDFSKVKFLHNNEVTNLKPADYVNLKLHDNVDWNKSLLSIRNEFQNMINPKVEYNSLDYEYYDDCDCLSTKQEKAWRKFKAKRDREERRNQQKYASTFPSFSSNNTVYLSEVENVVNYFKRQDKINGTSYEDYQRGLKEKNRIEQEIRSCDKNLDF